MGRRGYRERDAGHVWTPYRLGSIGLLEDSSSRDLPTSLAPPGRTVTPSALGSEVQRKHRLLL